MRYILGVDLGTTNSCVSFIDTLARQPAIQMFRIPQTHGLGHVDQFSTLPSFCYLEGAHRLPWNSSPEFVVGIFAREEGAKTPTKLIESAKSWLCQTAKDRHERLLPLEANKTSEKISPIEASARYLKHLRDAWNHLKAKNQDDARFEEQDIVLTVPASFDEIARALTVEAARLAGIKQLTLLEEPQAAFYSWLSQHETSWNHLLKAGEKVLVCDVGGGTTDFSLIDVCEKEGVLQLQRMHVGDHLLLGGDNMDICIAHLVEQKLQKHAPKELSPSQWLQLRHQARKAKEYLLESEKQEDSYRFLIQGMGSNIVEQTLSAHLDKQELQELLLKGFFPQHTLEDARLLQKSAGVKTMGLPYETEPAITKHLAQFLHAAKLNRPLDYVLFNGGTMKPPLFQQAILDSLHRWFPEKCPTILSSYHLDLAVARGASYYGSVRRGQGVRIGGGSGRGYYLAIDIKEGDIVQTRALTLLPRGSEEETVYESDRTFMLRPNTPISFTLYNSHTRLGDVSGSCVDIDLKELHPLPAIQTILRYGKNSNPSLTIPVKLGIALTTIGTLSIWLRSEQTQHRWDLEFQLKTSDGKEATERHQRVDETFDSSYLDKAKSLLSESFLSGKNIDKLMEFLEVCLEKPRKEWQLSLLRGLWDPLLSIAPQRRDFADNESRWWNLAGFLLRPGFGYPLDDFRIKELWKILLASLKIKRTTETDIQYWICLRRIAGGLNRGQQAQIAAELWPLLIDKSSGKIVLKSRNDIYSYTEKLRTAASLELVETTLKIKLGNALLARMQKESPSSAEYWALGRLGARHLFQGSIGHVVPRDTAAAWIEKLLSKKERGESWSFAVGQIGKKNSQRELNLPSSLVEKILTDIAGEKFAAPLKSFLTDATYFTQNEQDKVFGEQLPPGLVLEL